MRILYVAKIKISVCSVAINFLLLRKFLTIFDFNLMNEGGTMALILPSCISQIFMSYLEERTYKRMNVYYVDYSE